MLFLKSSYQKKPNPICLSFPRVSVPWEQFNANFTMVFLTLLVATIVCACIYIYTYVQKKKNFFKNFGVPYLSPVSIFDNLAGFTSIRKLNTEIIRKLYNLNLDAKYVGIYNFDKPVIVLRDLELIKNVVIKKFEHFLHHDVYADNDGAISSKKWQQYHNILSSSLNSTKMETMSNLVHENSHAMINRIYELAKDNPDNVYDMRDLFSKYNNDAIVNCALLWCICQFVQGSR